MLFNTNEMYGNIAQAQVNIYLIRYDKRSLEKSWAKLLPDGNNFNQVMLQSFEGYLNNFSGYEMALFNPFGHALNTISYIDRTTIQVKLNEILSLANDARNANANIANEINGEKENLIVCELEINQRTIYFITRYTNFKKSFRMKKLFLKENGRLVRKELNNLIGLNYNVDVVIEENRALIFNTGNFIQIFNYNQHMEDLTQEVLPQIREWNFISNIEDFIENSQYKYFTLGIAKIALNQEYWQSIQNANPAIFKRNVLNRSSNIFSRQDFDANNKIIITSENCQNFIKLIAKEFKYNPFNDTAEE